jgi:chromosome segregation ATPase
MVNQANTDRAQRHEMLQQRESSLQEWMDRMLNQRRISLEQEFERKCTENLEACRADFCSKTDTALERYKQGRETLERQVRDLEAEPKKAHEVHRGAERALGETDATMSALQRDISRLEEENKVVVQQIVDLTKRLQEAKDSEEEARMLCRQRVQMFLGFSAHLMEAAHHWASTD